MVEENPPFEDESEEAQSGSKISEVMKKLMKSLSEK